MANAAANDATADNSENHNNSKTDNSPDEGIKCQ
jgi:hypothetical protein